MFGGVFEEILELPAQRRRVTNDIGILAGTLNSNWQAENLESLLTVWPLSRSTWPEIHRFPDGSPVGAAGQVQDLIDHHSERFSMLENGVRSISDRWPDPSRSRASDCARRHE